MSGRTGVQERTAALKAEILAWLTKYDPQRGQLTLHCAWCDKPLEDTFDTHHYLVKRSGLSPNHFELIDVLENVVPLHPECHMRHGQTWEMARRSVWYSAQRLRADRVGRWYVSLWKEHGLPVRQGMLVGKRDFKPYHATELFELGCQITGLDPDEGKWIVDGYDTRALALAAWKGQLRRETRALIDSLPDHTNGVSFDTLVATIEQGYWMHYLLSVTI